MKKRGASLIWALVMSASLLFIAVTMASFVIRESQMSVRMDESSRAYAAAESGIEWGKYCVESLTLCDNTYESPVFYLSDSQYTVKVTVDTETKIESLGTSNGVNRKLEYILSTANTLQEVSNPIVGTFTIDGSYVQQFDYWTDGTGFASIGVGNSTGTKAIYFKHIGDEIRLEAINPDNTITSYKEIDTTSLDINEVYALQVRIEYFKDLSAKMTVSKRTFGPGGGFSCVTPTLVLDLREFEIGPGDLTKFYYAPLSSQPIVEPTHNIGHAPVYVMADGVNSAYIDNMATLGMIHSIPPAPPKNYTLTAGVQEGDKWGIVTAPPTSLDCSYESKKCSVSITEKTSITLLAEGKNGHTFNSWTGPFAALCKDTKSTSCVIAEGNIISNIDITALFNR